MYPHAVVCLLSFVLSLLCPLMAYANGHKQKTQQAENSLCRVMHFELLERKSILYHIGLLASGLIVWLVHWLVICFFAFLRQFCIAAAALSCTTNLSVYPALFSLDRLYKHSFENSVCVLGSGFSSNAYEVSAA